MRRVLLAPLLLMVVAASPGIAGDFGPTQGVTPGGCAEGQVAAAEEGLLRGYASCNDGRVLRVQRAAGRWTQALSGYRGRVVAFADDGSTSFVLLHKQDTTAAGGIGRLILGVKPHAGPERPLRVISREQSVSGASMVARKGRWWAVWSAGDESRRLWQAGDLLREQPAEPITGPGGYEHEPSLGMGARGQLVLAWTRGARDEHVRVAHTTSGAWRARRLSASNVRGLHPSVLADDAGAAVAYKEGNGPHRLRVALLPVPGRPRLLTRDGTDPGARVFLGGRSQAPFVNYGVRSRAGERVVLAKVDADVLGRPTDITPPQGGEAAFERNAPGQVLTTGSRVTVIMRQQRDSDPDPMYSEDASRIIGRTR